ncbi:MAG: nucleotidyltransferase domain-containing protein [Promethearchaeota archaeon]
MHKLVNIDIESREEIYSRLEDFIHVLCRKFDVEQVYLFGSFAKNQVHEGSDIDIIIVGDFKERILDRVGKILDLTDLPIEPLVCNREEFKEMILQGNPFITEVLKYAKRLV